MEQILQDKVAIVTGAGQGVGAAIARTLASAGARVAVNDMNPDRAEKIAAEIVAAGGRALGIQADVANKFQCVHLIETTRAEWGRLDILVNNAAVAPQVSVLKMDEWDWTRCLDVNLKGTFFMTQLCGRVMVDENGTAGGAIVNIGSTAGVHTPLAGRAAYCASKAAVIGFARECAREFAAYNIRVNSVLPGAIDGANTPSSADLDLATVPLGRLGAAQDIASAVRFLVSPAAAFITGATLTVDGGEVMA